MPYVTSFSQPAIIKLKSRICGFIYTRRSDCDVFNILFRNVGVRSIVHWKRLLAMFVFCVFFLTNGVFLSYKVDHLGQLKYGCHMVWQVLNHFGSLVSMSCSMFPPTGFSIRYINDIFFATCFTPGTR